MKFFKLNILLLSIFISGGTFAQSPLEIFGFYQLTTGKVDNAVTISGFVNSEQKADYLSSNMQQANVFLRKEITGSLTAFLNFEFTNNFSTKDLWGDFSIDEAWIDYNFSPEFHVQAGYLVPKFNNLNQVKNKWPMLPYILRPIVYEASLEGIIKPSDFLPEKALLQIYGKTFLGDLSLDYAAYAGLSESDYITHKSPGSTVASATDTSKFKLFGGRIGINYDNVRLGFSGTVDRDNQQSSIGENVVRYRMGADLGFSVGDLFVDCEVIKVELDPESVDIDMDKFFFYTTAEYDFTENLFAYAFYSYIEDNANMISEDGVNTVSLGGGYKVTDDVVLKLQYSRFDGTSMSDIVISPDLPAITNKFSLKVNSLSAAISIMF